MFSIGKKKLGELGSDFHLEVYTNGHRYTSNSANSDGELEILKTQELADDGGTRLRVWLRIDGTLSSATNSVALSDGLMIATFFGYVK